MKSRLGNFLGILILLLIVGGCTKEKVANNASFDERSNVKLKAAESSEAFESDVKAYFTTMLEDRRATDGNRAVVANQDNGAADGALDTSGSAAATEASASVNVSGTNLIETGVDEADLVKSDGTHLFVARQGTFSYYATDEMSTTVSINQDGGTTVDVALPGSRIYEESRSEPASIRVMLLDNETPDAKEISRIDLPERVSSVAGLYLSERSNSGNAKQLIAVTHVNINTTLSRRSYNSNNTWVVAYDVSNPELPTKQWEFEVEGYHHASRSMNGKLYLISSKYFWINELDLSGNELSIIAANERLIENLNVEDMLPTTWVNGVESDIVKPENCMIPQQSSKETVFGASLLAIYTIPVNAPDKTQSFCTLETSSEIYASTKAVYFTKGEYVPSNNLNEPGKYYTVIHKLKFTDDNVVYQSSARIPGWTGWRGNSFRLSELNGDLRIVVTEYETTNKDNTIEQADSAIEPAFFFQRRPVHRLYVLREDSANDNTLSILSQLPNNDHPQAIGKPGEEIYAVRYFADYAYIVTFQRTDPLYAINLKNPAAPFIEGELSIPGFSSYLHPINNDLLLGVGKDATDEGMVQGVKIALFDVSDKSNPITLNKMLIGKQGSDTPVIYDHRAFAILSDEETGIHKIALPISVNETIMANKYDWGDFTYYQWTYSGLQLLEVDDGSQSSTASMRDAGVIKAFEATTGNEYQYVREPRSVIANDAIHYIGNADVWSAMWDQPDELNGPN